MALPRFPGFVKIIKYFFSLGQKLLQGLQSSIQIVADGANSQATSLGDDFLLQLFYVRVPHNLTITSVDAQEGTLEGTLDQVRHLSLIERFVGPHLFLIRNPAG
jgi:hypothetical protein